MLYLYAIKKRIIIYLMMSLFLSAAGCRLSIKNTLLVPDGECCKENAEKIALHFYNTKGNKSGYDLEVRESEEDSSNYFVEIHPIFETRYELIDGDSLITILAGGGAMFTIDKKTCKIENIDGYE